MMKTTTAVLGTTLLAVGSPWQFAYATSPGLEVIQVVGSRALINDSNFVDDADIKKKQALDLEDLFRDQPNITVGGSQGFAQKIYVRGIEDTNLNISIDGATQSGQMFQHQARFAVEPELLKQVEVQSGAGTALDGFGALGGAIRFVTKEADDLLDADERFGALVKGGYFSNTDGYKVSANLYGRVNRQWSGLMVLSQTDTQDIKDGHGNTLNNTAAEQQVGLVKLSGDLGSDHHLTLSHEHRDDDGRRSLRPQFQGAPWNSAVNQKSRRDTSTLNYRFEPGNDLMDLALTAYQTKNRFAYYGDGDSDGGKMETLGLDLRNTSLMGEHRLTYGTEYREDEAYHNRPDASEQAEVWGVYLQDAWEVSDRLFLNAGVRYDHYQLDDAAGQHFSASGFSPNLSAVLHFDDNWSMMAGYSTALRGQGIRHVFTIGDVPNSAGLKEEKANNTELALEYANNGLQARAVVFRSRIQDAVATMGEPGPMGHQEYTNVGELETQGYNLSLSRSWSQLSLHASYSHTDPQINGQPLDDTHFGLGTSFGDSLMLSAVYCLPDIDLEFGWNGRLVRDLTKVPQGYPEKEGFTTHDLYLEWYPLTDDTLSVNLTINNLFDEFYYDHGTFGYDIESQEVLGLPEPGRDVRLTLGWRF